VITPDCFVNSVGAPAENGSAFSADAAARSRIEKIGMDHVRKVEESRGCRVIDVLHKNADGSHILSSRFGQEAGRGPAHRSKSPDKRAATITITRNELLYALNQADKFVLAIVLVGEDDSADGPYYVRNPFDSEPVGVLLP